MNIINNYFRTLLPLISLIILFSCGQSDEASIDPINDKSNVENKLLGEWRLIEILVDPGDGSGTFEPINSNETILFLNDLTFTSSRKLCWLIPSSHDGGTGSYSLTNFKIYPQDCDLNNELSYEFSGDDLVIHLICIESCAQKYEKVNPS